MNEIAVQIILYLFVAAILIGLAAITAIKGKQWTYE
jgi:hypothetical protein